MTKEGEKTSYILTKSLKEVEPHRWVVSLARAPATVGGV